MPSPSSPFTFVPRFLVPLVASAAHAALSACAIALLLAVAYAVTPTEFLPSVGDLIVPPAAFVAYVICGAVLADAPRPTDTDQHVFARALPVFTVALPSVLLALTITPSENAAIALVALMGWGTYVGASVTHRHPGAATGAARVRSFLGLSSAWRAA